MAFSPAEWRARQQLAACYRVFALFGWTDFLHDRISLRVPGPSLQVLLNPAGLHFNEITASSLAKVDADAQPLGRGAAPVDPAAAALHVALHEQLDGAHCVMQLHSTAGMAVAASERGLAAAGVHALRLPRVAVVDVDGPLDTLADGRRLAAAIGTHTATVWRHRGLIACGGSLPQALLTLHSLQRACEVQVAAAALGAPAPLSDAARERAAQQAPDGVAAPVFFEAWVRQIDRLDRGWRD